MTALILVLTVCSLATPGVCDGDRVTVDDVAPVTAEANVDGWVATATVDPDGYYEIRVDAGNDGDEDTGDGMSLPGDCVSIAYATVEAVACLEKE